MNSMISETGSLVNVLQRVTPIICLLLLASGCSNDTSVRQQPEPEAASQEEDLPVREWYPSPRRTYSPYQWYVPGQPPVQQAPATQPYQYPAQPQYIQKPWGGQQVPNATFNAQPPAAGYWPPSEQQQTHPWEVQPWQGGRDWGAGQNDVYPGYSSGYVW